MKLKNLKLATGALLSVGMFAVAGTPAIAQSLTESSQSNLEIAQSNQMIMLGRIQSITGNVATVRLEDGSTETIGLSRAMSTRLTSGQTVFVSNSEIVELNTRGSIASPSYNPDRFERIGNMNTMMQENRNFPMVGTIQRSAGNQATVRLSDGRTQTIGISRTDAASLVPGTRVFVSNGQIVEVDERGQTVERSYNPERFSSLLQNNEQMTTQDTQRMQQQMDMMRQTTNAQQQQTDMMRQQQMQQEQMRQQQMQQQQNRPVRGMW